eukprot:TRINITY_DN5302_c0_g1_i1.p1 TRINITY_DN5302_c0_g1~~TRINITY_DN5302_c0_g1_i1.p1  ORF type:complete len:189 (-),score=60.91 TRINITY_DN5302_c0_g1_i1:2-568(-)
MAEARVSASSVDLDPIVNKLNQPLTEIVEKLDSLNEIKQGLVGLQSIREGSLDNEMLQAIHQKVFGGPNGESIYDSMFGHMKKLVRQIPNVKKVVTTETERTTQQATEDVTKVVTAETERTTQELFLKIKDLIEASQGASKESASLKETAASEFKERISSLKEQLSIAKKKKYRLRGRSSETAKAHRG